MKHFRLLSVLVCLAILAGVAADASAMYHPGVGRFMQRDPGPDDSNLARQYADGANLYQYVQGNPIPRVDPSGLATYDCCCAESMDAIVDGQFVGDKTIKDYFPKLKDWAINSKHPDVAGPFISETRIGVQTQLIAKTSGDGTKCRLDQWVEVLAAILAGTQQIEPGTKIDDIKAGKFDQSKPPFRQYIDGSPSMADAVSLPKKAASEMAGVLTTCIVSGDGKKDKAKDCCKYMKCCVQWKISLKIDAKGNVTSHTITKEKTWCDGW